MSTRTIHFGVFHTHLTISLTISVRLALSSLYLRSSLLPPEPLLSVVVMLVAAFRKLAIDCFLLSCPEIDEGCEETVTKELSENTLESEFSVGLRFRVSFDGELGVED